MQALLMAAALASASDCAPTHEHSFACGAERAEDLAPIPGTRWLIASGFASGAGLKLVDTQARTLRLWYSGVASQVRRDTVMYPDCPGPPDAATFNVQGISLRATGDGVYTLHASNHGGREAIEVFPHRRAEGRAGTDVDRLPANARRHGRQ